MTMGPKIEMDDNTFHEVWNEMDYSGDGSVNFDEFKDAVVWPVGWPVGLIYPNFLTSGN